MKRNKILIVEDEEILLGVLQKKLSAEGFEVAMARNGEEGLEKIREIKPDLVLLDIIMPKKDGFAVLEEMAAEKEMKNIPVIMISNSGQELELEKALKMGAKDFFIKTQFEPQEVVEKINRQVGPAEEAVAVAGETISEEVKPTQKKEKILIVEDDQFLRDLMVRKLKSDNFEVLEATDGQIGLGKIVEERPDLILLDLVLPVLDGFAVLEKIKEDPRVSGIPVIILSNLGQQQDIEKGKRLGAIDFMIKAHFTPDEIVGKIKKALGSKKRGEHK